MAREEEFHRLGNREFQVHAPAVAQHHQEEAQASASGPHTYGSIFTPVALGSFTWGKVQGEKRLLVARANAVDIVLDDGATARVAGLAQTLVYLLGAIGVGIEPANNLALERIKFANPRDALAWVKLFFIGPLGNGTHVEPQGAGGLGHTELLAVQMVTYLAEGLIVEHDDVPIPIPVTGPSSEAQHGVGVCEAAQVLKAYVVP